MEDITLNVLEDCLYQSSERAILLQFAFQLTSVTQFIIPSLKAKYLYIPLYQTFYDSLKLLLKR